MTSFLLFWLMALFPSLHSSFLPVPHLFLPSPSPLPTSVSPCGGTLKIGPLFLFLLVILLICLVCGLVFLFSSFLHSISLPRRVFRWHVFCTRAQHVSLEANIFLVMIQYHPHGLHAVSAYSWQLSGLVLSPVLTSSFCSDKDSCSVLSVLGGMIGQGLRAPLSRLLVLSVPLAPTMSFLIGLLELLVDSIIAPIVSLR